MVLQLDLSSKDQKRLEKLEKIVDKLNKSYPNEYEAEEITHSFDELVEMQNEFAQLADSLNIENYVLDLVSSKNSLNLIVDTISSENKQIIKETFGNKLSITIDENIVQKYKGKEEVYKDRTEDWNSQGAGIGLRINQNDGSYYTCSTAGVAQKDTKLWVITAGHCNNHGNTFHQWNKQLGTTHLDATESDYDFLLIDVSGSPISRYASNGLYSNTGDTSTGYDSILEGSFVQKEGLRVCKVGITTNRTCGEVTVARRQAGLFNTGIVTSVVSGDGSILSGGGDSGGAWHTQSLPFRLVGIHQGGSKDIYVGKTSSGDPIYHSSESYFTPWVEVRDKYGLSLYTSDTKNPM
ncbi:S1 family peptidase [Aquibacillus sediminis]|uniref:S1 family peptidase n=1 Tax=Aquibacillus sediminis TaxID=2574734 RepID=UPI0011086DE8|nr:S1 family peptidase [Aquibacillus sediminis]